MKNKIFKFCQCIFAISLSSLLGKGCCPSIEQNWIPITQGFVPNLVEIGAVVLEDKMKMWKVRQTESSQLRWASICWIWLIDWTCLRLSQNCPISFGPHYKRLITTKRQWHDACGLLFAYLIIYMNYICIRRYMTEILLIGSKNTKQSINQSNSVAKNLVRNQLMWPCYFFTHQFNQYKQNQRKSMLGFSFDTRI